MGNLVAKSSNYVATGQQPSARLHRCPRGTLHLQFGFEAESLGTQVGYGSSHTGHGGGQTQLGVVPVFSRRLLHYPVVLDLRRKKFA